MLDLVTANALHWSSRETVPLEPSYVVVTPASGAMSHPMKNTTVVRNAKNAIRHVHRAT